MDVIISIKPQFVDQIIEGNKRFEFRKSFLKEKPEKCYIYSTKPVRKIVGFFTIKQVLRDSPSKIWEITKLKSGISRRFFDDYYLKKSMATAIEIDKVVIFSKPKKYTAIDPTGKIPQTYKIIK